MRLLHAISVVCIFAVSLSLNQSAAQSTTPPKTSTAKSPTTTSTIPPTTTTTIPPTPPRNPPPHHPPYPAHWWAPVNPATAPTWEVLPQWAAYGEVILSKRNELGLLSNFAATPFVFWGKRYQSVEGLWQGTKFPEDENDPRAQYPGLVWPFTRLQVESMAGFEAKQAGDIGSRNMEHMAIDWVTFEGRLMTYKKTGDSEFYRLMVEVMRAKLIQNPSVKKILMQTGDLRLRPDHDSGDLALKAWQYHEIWMKLRAEPSWTAITKE